MCIDFVLLSSSFYRIKAINCTYYTTHYPPCQYFVHKKYLINKKYCVFIPSVLFYTLFYVEYLELGNILLYNQDMNNIFKISELFTGDTPPVTLAPMAGASDRTMRLLCREYGADLTVSEMVSAKAIHFGDKKTDSLASITEPERPMAIQLFGSDPAIMAEAAAAMWERYKPEMIDINMGCPVPKVAGNGDGSALMRDPEKAGRVMRAVADSIPCPATAKIRAGWDDNSKNAVEVAKILEANGAQLICIHGRTRKQMYAPPVDLDIIAEVVRAVNVPVIGNGGIDNPADALKMLDVTGCAGIAVARGACGAPWLFEGIKAALQGKQWDPPNASERIDIAIRHLDMMLCDKGEYTGLREARKQLGWYLHGLRGATSARLKINTSENPDEVRDILCSVQKENQ